MKSHILSRSIAAFLDYNSVFLFAFILYILLGNKTDDGNIVVSTYSTIWLVVLSSIYWFLYFPVMEYLSGASLFKHLFGLRVVTLSHQKLTLGDTCLRHIIDIVEVYSTFGFAAFIIVILNDHRQRGGDMIAETTVMKKNEDFPADSIYHPINKRKFLKAQYTSMAHLPQEIVCVQCFEDLILDEQERIDKQLICPFCRHKMTF